MGQSTGFGVSQKSESSGGGMPSPPFDPTSAHNGTSIDGAGKVVLGNDYGTYPGAGAFSSDREIDMNGFNFLIGRADKSSPGSIIMTGKLLDVVGADQLIGGYSLIQVEQMWNTAGNATALDINLAIVSGGNLSSYLKMQDSSAGIIANNFLINGQFFIGNTGNGGVLQTQNLDFIIRPGDVNRAADFNGNADVITFGDVDAVTSKIKLIIDNGSGNVLITGPNGTTANFDPAASAVGLGDVDGAINGTQLQIFPFTSSITGKVNNNTAMSLDDGFSSNIYARFGDVGNAINGTTLVINDQNGRVDVTAAIGLTITSTDGIFLRRTGTALSNNAGAGAGAITNAPTAGNPTKWIAIIDAGVTRYIPTWQ